MTNKHIELPSRPMHELEPEEKVAAVDAYNASHREQFHYSDVLCRVWVEGYDYARRAEQARVVGEPVALAEEDIRRAGRVIHSGGTIDFINLAEINALLAARSPANNTDEAYEAGFRAGAAFLARTPLSAHPAPQEAQAGLIERFAQAAHWYINASEQEMQEQCDTRESALRRVHAISGKLLASGFEFVSATTVAQPATEQAEAPSENQRSTAYDMLDRFLRNNLGDSDYAEMSAALECVFATQPTASNAGEREAWPIQRFNLDANIDGVDQLRKFVLASDHERIVHDLETNCDPAGTVRENAQLRDSIEGLQIMYRAALASKPVAPPAREALTSKAIEAGGVLMSDGEVSMNAEALARFAAFSATTPAPAEQTDLCGHCEGSGTVRAMTYGHGPDDYEYDANCIACNGTGSPIFRDAIESLPYQPHSVTPGRQMVSREDVLRIIAARGDEVKP